MARFEVDITVRQKFVMAIESDSPMEAQARALDIIAAATPDNMELEITVNRGVS